VGIVGCATTSALAGGSICVEKKLPVFFPQASCRKKARHHTAARRSWPKSIPHTLGSGTALAALAASGLGLGGE
jgi:hypothetical protein